MDQERKRYNTDLDFIEGLKKNDESALRVLYKLHFPMVLKLILLNGGSEQEAKDIYQDGFIILYNSIRNDIFKKEASIKTYIYSICRKLWLSELKGKNLFLQPVYTEENIFPFENAEIDDTSLFEKNKRSGIIKRSLELIGEPCKTVICDFYLEKKSMEEISVKMNYTNAENAKNQKYKCLQRLKKIFFTIYNNDKF